MLGDLLFIDRDSGLVEVDPDEAVEGNARS
jgi:hypothetical protein